jgi:hypothetical protein
VFLRGDDGSNIIPRWRHDKIEGPRRKILKKKRKRRIYDLLRILRKPRKLSSCEKYRIFRLGDLGESSAAHQIRAQSEDSEGGIPAIKATCLQRQLLIF